VVNVIAGRKFFPGKEDIVVKKTLQTLLTLVMLQPFGIAMAITCAELDGAYVYSQESSPAYLGFFGNAYASESINNTYGTYGSS